LRVDHQAVAVFWCVSLLRFWPLKSTSGLRGLPELGGGGPSFGTKLRCEAQARIKVPSTEKCSDDSSPCRRA
jgi:hypothetical protein